MAKTIISEGKTTAEAIEKGLKAIGLPKDLVEIKVLEDNKKSFFDILAPKVVKVELKEKEAKKPEEIEIETTQEELEQAKIKVEQFLKEFVEKLIKLNRTAKVVKGGRRYSFSALTIVGDKKGRVGFGFGKANDVTEAIRKSIDKAKRNLVTVPLKNGTIPHEIQAEFKSSSVLLKPACSGTGIIAGGPVRAVLEAAGATDVMSKSLGSNTSVNVVRATFEAVKGLMDARVVAKNRSKTLKDLWG